MASTEQKTPLSGCEFDKGGRIEWGLGTGDQGQEMSSLTVSGMQIFRRIIFHDAKYIKHRQPTGE